MSIIAAVKVYDGIVLGAESMTQLFTTAPGPQPQQSLVKAYSHAQKIFQLGQLPVCVMTYGGGNIRNRSIESFVLEFSRIEEAMPPETDRSIGQIANRLLGFMLPHYQAAFGTLPEAQRPQIGFFVAGYSPNPGQHLASEWEFILPTSQQPAQVRPDDQVGASWRGIQLPFTRLFFWR